MEEGGGGETKAMMGANLSSIRSSLQRARPLSTTSPTHHSSNPFIEARVAAKEEIGWGEKKRMILIISGSSSSSSSCLSLLLLLLYY